MKKAEVHKISEQHLVGAILPGQLKIMSLCRIKRSDIAELIDAEFVKRKKASKRVDFN